MRKIVTSALATGILVAGGLVASTIVSEQAEAQTPETVPHTDEQTHRQEALDEVLSGLVDDGIIDQDQADEVRVRLVSKHDELRTERDDRREAHSETRELVREFLDDDLITAEELAQLPEDHPMRDEDGVFEDALADGQISSEELQDVRKQRGRSRRSR